MNQKSNITHLNFPAYLVFILLLLLLTAMLLPMVIIARYNVPSADDFSFSCETHEAIINNKSIFGIISGACDKVKDVYYFWQGTFSAVFMMAFQPSIWGFHYYSLTTWIMLISLLTGTFFLCFRIYSGVFQIRKSLSGIISVVISIIFTQLVPFANQSFYWYNGSVYYTFTFGLMLIMYAVTTGYLLYGGPWRIIIISLLGIIIGGSNYVTALLSGIISFSIILLLIIRKDKKWLLLLIPFILFLISFLISVIAPGNSVRQGDRPDHPGPAKAILLSFLFSFQNLLQWSDLRLLSCVLFLLPILWHAASDCKIHFRYPLFVTLFSYCVYSAAFTPHIYALASDGPDRLKNIIFFFYIILLVFNLFWWCGWIAQKKQEHPSSQTDSIRAFPLIGFSLCAFTSLIIAIFVYHGSLTSVLAINELKSGEAKAYYNEALKRQEVLEDPDILDCEFEPFENMPYLLFFTDMSDNPDDFQNEDTCTYYHKNSIIIK